MTYGLPAGWLLVIGSSSRCILGGPFCSRMRHTMVSRQNWWQMCHIARQAGFAVALASAWRQCSAVCTPLMPALVASKVQTKQTKNKSPHLGRGGHGEAVEAGIGAAGARPLQEAEQQTSRDI